jgi:hypothetical protein
MPEELGKAAVAETDTYAEKKLGMWEGGFDQEAVERLNKVYAAYRVTVTQQELDRKRAKYERECQMALNAGASQVSEWDPDPEIPWMLDEAVRREVCTAEEAEYLRNQFVADNGLPFVINLL